MALEIERKFLMKEGDWRKAEGIRYRQGYLCRGSNRVVRVRLEGARGCLTVKGSTQGLVRTEYEYEIPADEAVAMLETLCEKPLIEKTRYKIEYRGLLWEVDEFWGENQGLVIAEVELDSEDQPFSKPEWLGEEVTGDVRYYSANLVQHPFSKW